MRFLVLLAIGILEAVAASSFLGHSSFPFAPNNLVVGENKQIDEFESVISLLDSMSKRSSCFGTATVNLLVECDSLTVDMNESHKSRYAIDLTLCELAAAGIAGPESCKAPHLASEITSCVRSLEAKAQWYFDLAFVVHKVLSSTGGPASPAISEMHADQV